MKELSFGVHPTRIYEWFFSSVCHCTASDYIRKKGDTILYLLFLYQLWSPFMALILAGKISHGLSTLCEMELQFFLACWISRHCQLY